MLVVKTLTNLLDAKTAELFTTMADKCGLGEQSIRNTINKKRQPTNAEKSAIAEIFGVPETELFRPVKKGEQWKVKVIFEKM